MGLVSELIAVDNLFETKERGLVVTPSSTLLVLSLSLACFSKSECLWHTFICFIPVGIPRPGIKIDQIREEGFFASDLP